MIKHPGLIAPEIEFVNEWRPIVPYYIPMLWQNLIDFRLLFLKTENDGAGTALVELVCKFDRRTPGHGLYN